MPAPAAALRGRASQPCASGGNADHCTRPPAARYEARLHNSVCAQRRGDSVRDIIQCRAKRNDTAEEKRISEAAGWPSGQGCGSGVRKDSADMPARSYHRHRMYIERGDQGRAPAVHAEVCAGEVKYRFIGA